MRSLLFVLLVSTVAMAAPTPSPSTNDVDKRQGLDGIIGTIGVVISSTVGALDGAIGTVSDAGKGNTGTVGKVIDDTVQDTGAVVKENSG